MRAHVRDGRPVLAALHATAFHLPFISLSYPAGAPLTLLPTLACPYHHLPPCLLQDWLRSPAFHAKLPPNNGCFLLTDDCCEPMMRHLDGKTYQDPEQRSEAGLPPYPTDWTATLKSAGETAEMAESAAERAATEAEPEAEAETETEAEAEAEAAAMKTQELARGACELVAIRDAICWDYLAGSCAESAGCSRLHPCHSRTAVCGRHATTLLGLWGRRQRPPCPGDCGKAHPSLADLEVGLAAALPHGSRLHVHTQPPPPSLGAAEPTRRRDDGGAGCGSRSLYVAPSSLAPEQADAALATRAPMPLRVAIDVGFDDVMSLGERKSLATQCGLCHGIASQADARPHVALAICCGTPDAGPASARGGAADVATDVGRSALVSSEGGDEEGSFSLLRAAGLEQWRPLAWQGADGRPLSLLSIPGVDRSALVYLSPDAPDVLDALYPSDVYVIGGLVDRHKIRGASYQRAASLGIRCARLPLLEHLPDEMRGRSNALDALNLNSAFRLLVEWSRSRDWTAAIATAFDGSQRHCGKTQPSGMIHARGYWDGPFAASQHQYDARLSEALLAFFRAESASSVVDLGCGMGNYVRHFRKAGLTADGFDGNPATPQLSKGGCRVLDLSVVADVPSPYGWVMSLEVGEHLPKAYEDAFMENLHRHNACGMVLSWALVGQGGTGHVNEQNNDYVKAKICAKGYANDVEAEQLLRKASRFSYFKKTIMVFRRV